MKQAFFFLLGAGTLLISCSSGSNTKATEEKKDSSAVVVPPISYPFTAEYSSNFIMGDPKNSKLVLDFYQTWRDGRIDDLRSIFADTVSVDFADGSQFRGSADSLISMARKIRSDIESINYKIIGWVPAHSVDKNEDWVFVWDESYTRRRDGSKDSSQTHGIYNIKNGKLAYWGEYEQKFPGTSGK